MIVTGVRFPHGPPKGFNMKILCIFGMHKVVRDITWYYEPDIYCDRCGKSDITNLRQRYAIWASTHSMHPLAWPLIIFWSIQIWWYDRTHDE